jgi:hypothetical protein
MKPRPFREDSAEFPSAANMVLLFVELAVLVWIPTWYALDRFSVVDVPSDGVTLWRAWLFFEVGWLTCLAGGTSGGFKAFVRATGMTPRHDRQLYFRTGGYHIEKFSALLVFVVIHLYSVFVWGISGTFGELRTLLTTTIAGFIASLLLANAVSRRVLRSALYR